MGFRPVTYSPRTRTKTVPTWGFNSTLPRTALTQRAMVRTCPLVGNTASGADGGVRPERGPGSGVQGGGAPRPRPAQRKILSTWGG